MTSFLRYGYKLLVPRNKGSRRLVAKSSVYPLFGGICLGILLGFFFYNPIHYDLEKLHVPVDFHVKEQSADPALLVLRCVILLHSKSSNPVSTISAIRDTYGSLCNQTVYFTVDGELVKKVKDQNVKLLNINSNSLKWDYFLKAMETSSEPPASWTIFLDDQNFLIVHNLRKLVSQFDPNKKLMFARASAGNSIFEKFFSNVRIPLQAGIVLTASAIKQMSFCSSMFVPSYTESALYSCAMKNNISVIDPVDEDGKHLFNYIDIKTATHKSYQEEKKAKNEEVDCCSDHAITFGHQSYKDIRMAFFASSVLNVFGNGNEINYVNDTYGYPPVTTPKPTLAPTKKTNATQPAKKPDQKIEVKKGEEKKDSVKKEEEKKDSVKKEEEKKDSVKKEEEKKKN